MSDKFKQKRDFPLLSGLARGLTADIVGGPVDLATILVNSGLAAYGYAGNKLGMLKPSEMPDLIENPVGGSDWFAGKNTPLTDDGSARFTAGRLTGNLLPSLPSAAASLAPKTKPGQVNSLLGGLAKDDPSLWLSHGSNPSELLRSDGSLVRELYNPSFALTRDKLSEFKGSKGVIVPWPDKLDPKNAKTLITATDGYVPRWHASKAGRIDNLPWDVKLDSGLANPRVEEFINQRLFEKFGTPFPRQGIKAEGGSGAPEGALPLLGQGKGGMTPRKNPVYGRGELFANRIAMSPRFQSLESFAQSPYGGKLVGETTGRDRLQEVETELEALYKNLLLENTSRWKGPNDPAQVPLNEANGTFGSGFSRIDLLKGLASNTHPSQLYSRFKSPDNFLSQLRISDNGTPRPLTPAETRDLQKTAGRLLGQIKTAPSDYAELKSYGSWQVSGDNVAGIVERKDYFGNSGALREASAARGLPYAFVDSRADETAAAADFLSRKGKSQVSLVKGLAGKLAKDPFEAADAGYYFEGLGEAELKAFDLTKLFKTYDDKSVLKAYDAALANTASKPSSIFFKTAGIDSPTPAAKHGVNWMMENMSLAKAKAGEWDYIPDGNMPLLEQFASAGGHDNLKQSLAGYKHASLTGTNKDHDAALYKVLEIWDQVKPGAAKPAAGVTPEMAAELKALEDLEFTPVKEPSLATGMAKPVKGPETIPNFANQTFGTLMGQDTTKMSPDVWMAWDKAQKAAKDQLIKHDWSKMSPAYLKTLIGDPVYQFFPVGAKLKIKEALGSE